MHTSAPGPRPSLLRRRFARIADKADIRIDPPERERRAWDILVRDERVFRRVALQGFFGLSEAYVDGWWDCDAVDQLAARALRADLPARLWMNPTTVGQYLRERLLNLQSARRARHNASSHYDLDSDLFRAMLDRRMVYSCAYWDAGARTLDEAQEHKLELICRKLHLEPGMRVLDIGCGWGGLARHLAERYACAVVGITLSDDQARVARERCAGLPVEIRLQDYRALKERFDRVVSVGMFEHVGPKNHRAYMRVVRRSMRPDALALLHFFTTQRSWPNLRDTEVIWVARRIFPNFVTPSPAQVERATRGLFVLEDLHNLGLNYDPTLMAWHERFEHAWPDLHTPDDERFRRLWSFYLRLAAGAFRARKYQVWQIVLSPRGVPGGYRPVRTLQTPALARQIGAERVGA